MANLSYDEIQKIVNAASASTEGELSEQFDAVDRALTTAAYERALADALEAAKGIAKITRSGAFSLTVLDLQIALALLPPEGGTK